MIPEEFAVNIKQTRVRMDEYVRRARPPEREAQALQYASEFLAQAEEALRSAMFASRRKSA